MFSQKVHCLRSRFSVGDRVCVKLKDEILKGLGPDQKKDGCLFMNNMFSLCGQTYQVKKAVHHFFDEYRYKLYRTKMPLYVLDGLLCDGVIESFHQRCDRSCYFLWHEDWLEDASRFNDPEIKRSRTDKPCDIATEAIQPVQEIPFCQLTNIHNLAQKHSWFNDFFQLRTKILRTGKRTLTFGFNRISRKFRTHVVTESLKERSNDSIHEDDIVKVKSRDEIRRLLDDRNKYKRLLFIDEMYEFCDREYKVLKVIDTFYDEAQNKMCTSKNVVILEDVICSGRQRLYRSECDRSCFFFWHTAWLKKIQSSNRS
jgi:hypothetical protein